MEMKKIWQYCFIHFVFLIGLFPDMANIFQVGIHSVLLLASSLEVSCYSYLLFRLLLLIFHEEETEVLVWWVPYLSSSAKLVLK